MSDSPTSPFSFQTLAPLALEAAFDGGQITSDGGLPWLAAADTEIGVCAEIAAHVPDWRREARAHPLAMLICQRVSQIACGYEDQNDATTLRPDPLLKLVCGRLPERDAPLASQPTLSRLENAVSARDCYRIALALGTLYLRERGAAGIPLRIVLDLDSTDDPTHGSQEGTRYHGYYRQQMYHPLLIFDGDTDQLITAVLRPGNAHAGKGIVAILKRIIRALRVTFPGVAIAIRADAGFALPTLYEYCEADGIELTVALLHNSRLAAAGAALLAAALQQSIVAGGEKVRLCAETTYQAGSWAHPRRVVFKAEAQRLPKGTMGTNVRFVVTSRDDPPEALYDWYTQRGGTEGWIKDLKNLRQVRPPQLSSLLGKPISALPACGSLLVAGHAAPQTGGDGGGTDDAGDGAAAGGEDRRAGTRVGRGRQSAPRHQPPRSITLASTCRRSALMNNAG